MSAVNVDDYVKLGSNFKDDVAAQNLHFFRHNLPYGMIDSEYKDALGEAGTVGLEWNRPNFNENIQSIRITFGPSTAIVVYLKFKSSTISTVTLTEYDKFLNYLRFVTSMKTQIRPRRSNIP